MVEALTDPEAVRQVASTLSSLLPFLAAHTHALQPFAAVAKHLWAQLQPAVNYTFSPAGNLTPTVRAPEVSILKPWLHNVSRPIRYAVINVTLKSCQ